MLCIRPSIGWLSYFVIRQSPGRLGLVLVVGLLLSLVCVWESQFTLTLTYQAPGLYPPPVIIMTPSDMGSLTAWDACGVEAATRPVKVHFKEKTKSSNKQEMANRDEIEKLLKDLPNPMKIHGDLNVTGGVAHLKQLEVLNDMLDHHDKSAEIIYEKMVNLPSSSVQSWNAPDYKDEAEPDEESESVEETDNVKMEWDGEKGALRDVWVYQWKSTVFKGDKWTHFLSKLPSVHLNYFDPKKGVPITQLRSWGYREGLTTQTTWVGWVTAALRLLWGSGGIVLPSGVILTSPLTITVLGRGEGVVLEAGKGEDISPLVLGVPPQHGIVSTAMNKLASDAALRSAQPPNPTSTPHAYLSPAAPLLTEAMRGACNTEGIPDLGDCVNFLLLPHQEAVAVDGLKFGPPPALKTLLLYAGPPEHLQQPDILSDLFKSLNLKRFCPKVAGEVLWRYEPGL